MDDEIKKMFEDLESNQTQVCEEAKQKMVEIFQHVKEQWLVCKTMNYYLQTGSQRILEILVKVQQPHDDHIFGRLSEMIKAQTYRVQALQLFLFIVRRHPTWLFKVDRKSLIREIFKLLLTEKEIVPLMCALLCIITLLPIMPSLVPTFREELFNIFGRLASWKCQNPNGLPDDKLVHLQFGLQILFHRLYGMYPWNFITYLSDFIKRDKGAIYHHTIKPLLETVRIHPLLVTASIDSEVNLSRWKDMEPHDVVVECAKLSLPVMHQEFSADHTQHLSELLRTPGGPRSTPTLYSMEATSSSSSTGPYLEVKPPTSTVGSYYSQQQIRELQKRKGSVARFDQSSQSSGLWSPYSEITSAGSIPLTPTPSYILPQTAAISSQLLEISGSSPPEAAVEATPETTPLKDFRQTLLNTGPAIATPHAVRAIFAASQPTSPLRKDINQFSFPDVMPGRQENRPASCRELMLSTSSHDRQLMQPLLDRAHSQSPFQTIEALAAKDRYSSPYDASSKCDTPDVDSELSGHMSEIVSQTTQNSTPLPNIPTQTHTPTTHVEPLLTKTCDECNETERSLCSAGGLQMPTSRSMQMLAKGLKRRTRMASYCYNEASCEKICESQKEDKSDSIVDTAKVRRTKSCSSIYTELSKMNKTDDESTDNDSNGFVTPKTTSGNRLQKSNKMLAIPTVVTKQRIKYANAGTQTLDTLPQDYEQYLYELLFEHKKIRTEHERNLLYPEEILEQYIKQCKESLLEASHRVDKVIPDQIPQLKEQYQLICLKLEYERYRREIHAERNRRLMGRSRDKRSLEMERDRLREQLNNFVAKNKELLNQIDRTHKNANEREQNYIKDLNNINVKYQHELEQNKCLRQANELLQTKLNMELQSQKTLNAEVEALKGEIFDLKSELNHAEQQVEIGLHCKQELARLEAEFIIMGEIQVKCHDYLNDLTNHRALDEEIQMLQEAYHMELKEQRKILQEKSHQLENANNKIQALQSQLSTAEKMIAERERNLRTVKDAYEEKFKAVNRKYDIQKTIIIQMEEKLMMALQQAPSGASGPGGSSPDTDKTDMGSSIERNSPLSTSQASSESLSMSLRSNEMRNLHQLIHIPIEEASDTGILATGINFREGSRIPNLDLASSANTATGSSLMAAGKRSSEAAAKPSSSSAVEYINSHASLQTQSNQSQFPLTQQQQQQQQQHQQKQHQQLKRS